MDYPQNRPQFFCCQWMRTLFASGQAAAIGANGVALMACVLSAEDANHYKRPAEYTDPALAKAIGASVSTLARTRAECVAAGFLVYKKGRRSVLSQYWATGPAGAGFPGETRTESEPKPKQNQKRTKTERPKKPKPKAKPTPKPQEIVIFPRQVDVENVIFPGQLDVETGPFLGQVDGEPKNILIEETHKEPQERIAAATAAILKIEPLPIEGAELVNPWDTRPGPRERFPMADAIAELTGRAVDGRICKVAYAILKDKRYWGDDPRWRGRWVSPDEIVSRFPRVLQDNGQGWRFAHGPVGIELVEAYWHWLREPPKIPLANNRKNGNNSAANRDSANLDTVSKILAQDGKPPF